MRLLCFNKLCQTLIRKFLKKQIKQTLNYLNDSQPPNSYQRMKFKISKTLLGIIKLVKAKEWTNYKSK